MVAFIPVFTIQKIEKEPELIEINRDSANMTVGDFGLTSMLSAWRSTVISKVSKTEET